MNKEQVIYHVHYNGTKYTSIKQELSDVEDQVYHLSEHGTNGLKILKIPISETNFLIFSEEQIKTCLIEVEIIEGEKEKKTRRKTKKDDDELGMIKS